MSSPAPVTGPLQTRASLAAALRDLGVRPGETLLAHTSLSSLGWVCGGPVALVQALLDAVGPDGTLTVPTHSGDNSDPAGWSAPPVPEPWWPAIRAHMPPYDPRTTPSRGVGVVPETLRTWPGALRSAHPQTSFAALGPGARALVEGHALDCRLGEQSPLARLEEAGARVLLLGTGYASCTAFHLAEYRISGPRVRNSFAVRTPSGPRWTTVTDTSVSDEGFAELGADFERSRAVVRGTVGGATARLFPLAAAVAHAERWLPVHRPRTT
ncbi:aminoglycoside N(3)-acetyltransferase [Streptomyces sp. NBU3104]|uniref:aminoglycoside N(3)-acetyltransferase n=1 Tax=Streptomyces sp. NBU3104 TaxID=2911367 RepID=UPI001EDA18B2|nr:AAC(3) family N-acetyltransferase [Streptomyces sp. NBU3104]UKL05242.1 AAC(3) family N-acetyltransferase [Streptomyces sp. NBU3104]